MSSSSHPNPRAVLPRFAVLGPGSVLMGTRPLWLSYSPSLRSQTDLDFSRLSSGTYPRELNNSLGTFLLIPSLAPHMVVSCSYVGLSVSCELHQGGAVSSFLWV